MKRILGITIVSALVWPLCAFSQGEEKDVSLRGQLQYEYFEAFDVPTGEVEQAFLQKLRDEIATLNRIAKKIRDPRQKAELLFRIAENYRLMSEAEYFREMERYESAFKAYMEGRRKQKPKEPDLDLDAPFRLYNHIIKTAPRYDRMDDVLFWAGLTAEKSGKPSHTYYQRLVRKYPKSPHVLDSYMKIGEWHFQNRRFNRAIANFNKVLEEDTKLYDWALYKISWCYYNQGKVRSAMSVMQRVVKNSRDKQGELDLRDEALKDLVIFYSDLGLVDEAQRYFVSIGEPEFGIKVMEKLALTYFDQSRYKLAITTFRKLLRAIPYGEDRPKHHSKLIESYEKSQQLRKAMYEMEQFITSYGKDSQWWAKNTDSDVRDYAYNRAEVYGRFIPKKYHEEAQKVAETDPRKARKGYQAALVYYKKYLDRFSEHENAYGMRFLYAELLFKNKNYELAATQFENVFNADQKGKHREAAVLGQIDSLTRLEEREFEKLQKRGVKQKDKYDPIPLSKYAKKLVAADLAYTKAFSKDPKVPQTLLHRGTIFYNYNQFDKALEALFSVTKRYPRSAASNNARNLILDIYNVRKDWVNLEKYASAYLKNKQFATPENKKLLLKLIQGSIFERAKEHERKGEYRQAAKTYLRLTNKYPESEFADKSLFNATISYINADDAEEAMRLARRFLRSYPKSDMTPKILLALATYFDDKLDYAYAAYYYEQLADKAPKEDFASDALFNAGLYRERLAQYRKALRDYDVYLKRYPRKKDAADIFFSRGLIYEKLRNWRKTVEVFQQFPRKYGSRKDKNVEAYYRKAQAYDKLRNSQEATKARQTAVWLFKKYSKDRSLGPNIGAKYAAKAHFELLEDRFQRFDRIKLGMPQSRLARAIEQKARLLGQLKDGYLEIINYGDAEMGVAALYQVGLTYQKFSESLFSAPIPPELNPEEVQLYQQELQNRAAPIEQKAIEAYEKGVKKAYELGVFNQYTKKSRERLSQYKPSEYPTARGKTTTSLHFSDPFAPLSERELRVNR